MRTHLDGLRQIVPRPWQHVSDWYDRGYLDHQWGYTHRNCGRMTAAQHQAYDAGWQAADADGTADCYARPDSMAEPTARDQAL